MDPITINFTAMIVALVIGYLVMSWGIARSVCRRGLSASYSMDTFDKIQWLVSWILAPLWMPLFGVYCGIFNGISHDRRN